MNGEFIPAWRYSQGIYKLRAKSPSLFVIHYALCPNLEGLVNYFNKNPDNRYADSTWCVGQDGQWCQMVRIEDTPWTNGSGLGLWPDENGQLTWMINDIAFTVETANDVVNGFNIFTENHYSTLASLFKWTLNNFPYTKLWRVCGHEHLTPDLKVDPGPFFDWERFLVGHCGMKPEFYSQYMKYLQDAAAINGGSCWTGLDPNAAAQKKQLCLAGAMRLEKDMAGKSSAFALA